MTNYKGEGKNMMVTAGEAYDSGDVVKVGSIIGVAMNDIANGAEGAIAVEGVYELPKKVADNLTQGLPVYWDDTNNEVTLTSTDNTPMGWAYEAAAATTASVVKVKLGRF